MLTEIPPELDVPQSPGAILDVGCGLQPQALWPTTSQGPFSVGVDAHLPYLEKLREDGFDGILVHATWDEFMPLLVDDSFDVIVALDFIEHLQRGEGKQFLKHAKRVGRTVSAVAQKRWAVRIPRRASSPQVDDRHERRRHVRNVQAERKS